ncbi:UNKNOWN [Stylonychia lemnae]|uniref:Uncharacterized protein n=1 Tax=Stylonychia lemnae TaxID=5949 RepID=A0A078ACD0_STYLE|nr:UNKNOWN [Stylonychia lemnae]|eukprot:CDW79496.1 UNKNOWN [Stylonychia lemnae]
MTIFKFVNLLIVAFVLGFILMMMFDILRNMIYNSRLQQIQEEYKELILQQKQVQQLGNNQRKAQRLRRQMRELNRLQARQLSLSLQDMDIPSSQDTSTPHASHLIRTLQSNLTYHSEANEWRLDQHQQLHNANENIHHNVNGDTMELLASSARNSTTPIRPYQHHNLSERANHRQSEEGIGGVISGQSEQMPHSQGLSNDNQTEISQRREYHRGYFSNLRPRRPRNALQVLDEDEQEDQQQTDHELNVQRYAQQIANMLLEQEQLGRDQTAAEEETQPEHIPTQSLILENTNRSVLQSSRGPRLSPIKPMSFFRKTIPEFWLEILEKDNQMMFSIMKAFGSLACLLYYRIGKLCKERTDIRDLRLLSCTTSNSLNEAKREEDGGKYYELKFLTLTLDFFNYNISLAKRDLDSKIKVDLLVSTFPSLRELRQSIENYFTHKDDYIVYKIVLEMYERYYQEFGGVGLHKLRKQVIPFAKRFYSKLDSDKFQELKNATRHFKQYYPNEYLQYYERKRMDIDNLGRETKKSKYIM